MAPHVHNIQSAGHADWAGKRDVLIGEGLGVTSVAIFNCVHQNSVHSIPLFKERQLFVCVPLIPLASSQHNLYDIYRLLCIQY
jgi:hypothetical protein